MKPELKPGMPVRFNHFHGSWGVIEEGRHYDDGFYVRWNYGKNVHGEPITDLDSVARTDLVPVDPDLYNRYINARAFSEEQREIAKEFKW